jgi:hypothetical protein
MHENMSLICDKYITIQNLAFLSYWYRNKRLKMHFSQVLCHNAVCKTRRWRAVVFVVALIENDSTSELLKVSPGESQILSCDTLVVNERCNVFLLT